MIRKAYPYPFSIKTRMPDQTPNKKYESFDEYAKKLGVFPTQDEINKLRKKRTKGKITTHGVDRIKVAKQGPKPKRMLRIDCEND